LLAGSLPNAPRGMMRGLPTATQPAAVEVSSWIRMATSSGWPRIHVSGV
jgi:hypothetical protein